MKSIIQCMRVTGLFVLLTLFLGVSSVWATTPVERLVQQSGDAEATFSVEQARYTSNEFDAYVSEYVIFDYDTEVSRAIQDDSPEVIEVSFPTARGSYNLKLVQQNVISPEYRVESSTGQYTFDEQLGTHYRGVVEGYDGSIATVSFYNDEVSIFASTREHGNFTANKTEINGETRYVSYFDSDLLIESGFECATEDPVEVPELLQDARLREDLLQQFRQGNDVCIRVHFEADFNLYTNKGSVANTAAYIESFFNVVTTLYNEESINTVISYIHVWDSADPFFIPAGGGSSDAIDKFQRYIETGANLNGDLGHLVALDVGGFGGVARGIGVLCLNESSRLAYSDINASYNPNFPTYSWTVMVVSHEMGHNLGSPHTHGCYWNGNATQIDDCGNANGALEGASCYDQFNPILPPQGGSIMSYCHLANGIGISFSEGFLQQPGDLIRSTITSCSDLTSCPVSVCAPPYQIDVTEIDETSATVSWYHADERLVVLIEKVAESSTTTPVSGAFSLDLTGLDAGTKYDVTVKTVCEGPDSESNSEDFATLCNTTYTLPFIELFEEDGWEIQSYELEPCWSSTIDDLGYGWSVEEFETNSQTTGPSGDHTTGFGKYVYAEASFGDGGSDADLISPQIDLGSASGPFVSFWYHMFGTGIDGLEVEVSNDDGSSWDPLDEIDGAQQGSTDDPWQQAIVSLSDYEGETIRIRFTAKRGLDAFADIAIDDVIVTDSSLVDVSITELSSPASGCGLSSVEEVTITVLNSGYQTLNSGTLIGLELTVDAMVTANESLTLASNLAPGSSVDYTFAATVDLGTPGEYSVSVTAALAGDGVDGNDSRGTKVVNKPIISSYPYIQSFESGSDWTSGGINNSWALGTPAKSVITGASDGSNAWVTGGLSVGSYNSDEFSYVEGPCFDFSNLQEPTITMDVWWEIEPFWEGAQFQYSTDQGENWNTVGDSTAGWYNGAYILTMLPDEGGAGWTGAVAAPDPARPWLLGSDDWVTVSHDLTGLGLETSVFLRMVFKSDPFVEFDGIAFDNIRVDGVPICYRTDVDSYTCDPGEVGIETEVLEDITGCDSVVSYNTLLLPSYDIVFQEYSCDPADTGTVVDELVSSNTCDSIITTITSLWPSYQYSIQETSCDPDDVGVEVFDLETVNGCDSVVLVNTSLRAPYTTLIESTTCNSSAVMMQIDTMMAVDGCDSIVTSSVTFDPVVADFSYSADGGTVTFTNESSNATSYSWTFGDDGSSLEENPTNVYTESGDYVVVLVASETRL